MGVAQVKAFLRQWIANEGTYEKLSEMLQMLERQAAAEEKIRIACERYPDKK